MSPADIRATIDALDGIGFEDFTLWSRRQALVRKAGLDEQTIVAIVGTLQVHPVCFHAGRFDLEIRGVEREPAVILGALDDYERLVDLVAWPIDRPAEMATLCGRTAMLGERQAWAPSGIATPLRVHRTALAWILAHFEGCVPIDARQSARVFLDLEIDLLADDDRHGAELDQARRALLSQSRILVAEAA